MAVCDTGIQYQQDVGKLTATKGMQSIFADSLKNYELSKAHSSL